MAIEALATFACRSQGKFLSDVLSVFQSYLDALHLNSAADARRGTLVCGCMLLARI
jgi:hypothetical protein